MQERTRRCALGLLLCLLAGACSLRGEPELKSHTEEATSECHEYVIEMSGTMDGVNTRSAIGYAVWSQEFEPNISVRIENVGDTDVVNPWLLVNGKRNWRSVEDIVVEATEGRKTDKERALGIWQFEIGNRFHWTTGDAENNDPVKVFNVYGYTLCGNDAHVISDLWRTAGFEVRRGYPQGHCTAEVFYDGAFHHMDGDESIVCLDRDNQTIVDEAAIVRDHDLMKRTHTYGILAADNRGTDEFSASLCVYEGHRQGEHRSHIGHTMGLVLRPGEALEWRWDNIGRYHSRWSGVTMRENILARVCNGRLSYAPKLAEIEDQSGTVWEIRSPYVIVGGKIAGMFVRPSVDSSCILAVSLDGKEWQEVFAAPVGEAAQEISLDDVLPCDGPPRYAYHVRLSCGGGGGAKQVALESVVQMAPLSLPALEVGANHVAYVSDSKGAQNVRITHRWREGSDSRPPVVPAAPVYPVDGGDVVGTQFVFEWEDATDPDGDQIADYHFQLSDRADMLWHLSPNFNRLVSLTADKGGPRYSIPCIGLLSPSRQYFWRVRARDEKGVWSAWSRTWSFTPRAPGVPRGVYLRTGSDGRTVTLHWSPNPPVGTPPVTYRVYGSDEKGFTVSDTPHEILYRSIQGQSGVDGRFGRDLKEMPGSFAWETTETSLVVVGRDVTFPNANRAYYRVVAVDADGVRSGASSYAETPRPFIYSLPETELQVGRKWDYQVKSVSSLGDLRCRTFVPGKYVYNAGFWDSDVVRFRLHNAPAWLAIDSDAGLVSGTPGLKDIGEYSFLVLVDIPKVACRSQNIRLTVK